MRWPAALCGCRRAGTRLRLHDTWHEGIHKHRRGQERTIAKLLRYGTGTALAEDKATDDKLSMLALQQTNAEAAKASKEK